MRSCVPSHSCRNGQAPHAQRDLKLARRHVLGLLPTIVAVPAARADEGTVTLISETENLSGYQAQVLEYNLRIQRQNNAPTGFPSFIRDKFDIAVIAEGYQLSPEGAPLHAASSLCLAAQFAPGTSHNERKLADLFVRDFL